MHLEAVFAVGALSLALGVPVFAQLANPYGEAISSETAKKMAAAALAEARKNNWTMAAAVVDTAPTFVRQLTAIDATQDMLVTAVSDFLRSEADKVSWAEEGRIFPDSFVELDGQLERRHGLARGEIEDVLADQSEYRRGRALDRKCAETELPLEGQALPGHFIAGAFNSLADLRRVGWHPNYRSLFPKE